MPRTTTTPTRSLVELLFEDDVAGRCLVAPDGTVLRANSAWLRATGFDLDRVLGADIVDLFPGTRDMSIALHGRARAGHRVEVPRHAQVVNGRETWWEGSIEPVAMDGGTGLLITAREVTGAAAAEGRHAAELLELGDPFCELDREFRVVRVNAAHERINGHRREQVLGRTHWEVWPETAAPDSPYWREYHRCIAERVPVQFDAHYAPLDVWTSVSAYPTTRGGIAIFWRDDTARKRVEAALRRSEQRFKALFTNMTDAFAVGELVLGPGGAPCDFMLVEMNEAFERHTGIDRERAANRPFSEVAPAIERYWLELCVAVVGDGVPRRVMNFNRDTGRHYDVYCYRPEPGRFATIFSDVSGAKRRAEETAHNEELLRRLFERVPVMIALYHPALGTFRFNDELRRVLGWTEEDAASGDFMAMAYPDPADRAAAVEHMTTLAPGWRELRITAKDGTSFPSSWANIRLSDDTQVGIGIDLRERKRSEEQLRSVNERLREADRRKDDFLAMLSHELRNPLAPIRNGIYLLERAAPDSAAAVRAREVIGRQTEHLASLVGDLLDMTRISRGKIELQRRRFDAREVVRKAAEDLYSVFQAAGVELRIDHGLTPIWIDADPTRIAQVVGNLLQNAAKFTPSRGHVDVEVATRDGLARIVVRDDGIGMEPGSIPRMFDAFAQAHQGVARSSGGLGLGLALVKGIVELHGGTVQGRSDGPGRGAEFVVELPLAAGGADVQRRRGGRPVVQRRIVIIEDNVDAAETLADVLRLDGHEVSVARDARSGIELVRRLQPDVVLCDVGLPDADGYAVARDLRRDETLRSVLLVALSGYAQPDDRERARAAGFDAHVAKPPDLDELGRLLAAR